MAKSMSLADELEDFFEETNEVIVTEPLRFKASLGIGEKAYGLLRAKENLSTFAGALGMGGTAAGIASSGAVASTFFAGSGFMASTLSVIGLGATAVTPVGWILAASVISGGAYLGVTNLLERSKDNGLVIVPKYINTPLDVIAVALIELMLPVSLKIAHADGEMQSSERQKIQEFFCEEWGYCPGFVSRLIDEYQHQIDAVSYSALAESLAAYCSDSKDCDREAIMTGFVSHLHHIVEADGIISDEEKAEMEELSRLLVVEAELAGGSAALSFAIESASEGLKKSALLATSVTKSTGEILNTGLSTSKKYIDEVGKPSLNKSAEWAESGLETGKQLATELGTSASSTAKNVWRKLTNKTKN